MGGELYSSWQEVPNDLKTTRVQRSMFPPGAYTSSEAAAEVSTCHLGPSFHPYCGCSLVSFVCAVTCATRLPKAMGAQLRKCGRLLPSHDDGGCFFLALFRRSGDGVRRFRRGDRFSTCFFCDHLFF